MKQKKVFNEYKRNIKKEVLAFQKKNNQLPTVQQLEVQGLNLTPFLICFKSWNACLREMGIKPTVENNKELEDTLAEIQDLSNHLGRIPSYNDIVKKNIPTDSLMLIFGNWRESKKYLKDTLKTDNYILSDEDHEIMNKSLGIVKELTLKNKRIPTIKELKNNNVNINKLLKVYPNINSILEQNKIIDSLRELLLDDLLRLSYSVGGRLTLIDVKNAKLNIKPLLNKYTWKELSSIINETQSKVELEENKLVTLAKTLDDFPSIRQAKENQINTDQLIKKYGNWKSIKKSLYINDKSSLENLKSLEQRTIALSYKINRTPRIQDLKNNGLNPNPLIYAYGSWNNALKKMGFQVNAHFTEDDIYDLEEKLKNLAIALEKPPLKEDLKENNIPIFPLIRKHGSLTNCLDDLGITNAFSKKKSVDESINELINLCKELKQFPTIRHAKELGINTYTLTKHYGNWSSIRDIVIERLIKVG